MNASLHPVFTPSRGRPTTTSEYHDFERDRRHSEQAVVQLSTGCPGIRQMKGGFAERSIARFGSFCEQWQSSSSRLIAIPQRSKGRLLHRRHSVLPSDRAAPGGTFGPSGAGVRPHRTVISTAWPARSTTLPRQFSIVGSTSRRTAQPRLPAMQIPFLLPMLRFHRSMQNSDRPRTVHEAPTGQSR